MIEKKIQLLEGVDVSVQDRKISVKGAKGSLEKTFADPRFLKTLQMEKEGGEIIVRALKDTKKHRAMVGTIVAHVKNMMKGAGSGFRYTMKIFYTHFPINISVKDKEIQIRNFLGEKGARTAKIIGRTDMKVEKDEIILTGPDLEELGQTAANIELACKISKRDRRIFQDGIYLSERGLQAGAEK